jgi:hypothetical protein
MCALNRVRKHAACVARKIRASKRALFRLGFFDVAIAAARSAPPASESESAAASLVRCRCSLFLNSSRL